MKKTVDLNDFRQEFEEMGRGDQFSWAALETLFAYLEELEEGCGEEFELDVIALCCDWGEYDSEDLIANYGHLLDRDNMDEEETTEYLVGLLRERTDVLEVENGNYLVMTDFGG